MVTFPLSLLWIWSCAGSPLSPWELLCNLLMCGKFKSCFFPSWRTEGLGLRCVFSHSRTSVLFLVLKSENCPLFCDLIMPLGVWSFVYPSFSLRVLGLQMRRCSCQSHFMLNKRSGLHREECTGSVKAPVAVQSYRNQASGWTGCESSFCPQR